MQLFAVAQVAEICNSSPSPLPRFAHLIRDTQSLFVPRRLDEVHCDLRSDHRFKSKLWPDHSRTLRDLFSEACPALSGLPCSGTGLQMRLWIWPWFIVPSITTGPLVPAAERWTRPRCDLNRPVFVVIGPFLLFQQMKKSYRTFSDIWMDFFFFSSFELSNSWIGIWQTLISSVRPTFTMKTWITAETLQRLLCSRETLCLSDSWVSTSLNKPFSSWIWPDGRHHNPHTEQYSRNSEEYPYLHSFSRTKYCSGRFRRDILEFARLHFRPVV